MSDACFCGVLKGDALARTYADLDLFVFPSESETFGLAVLEAMASGLPVVTMARGGPTAFVQHGISGWLAGDEDEFVDAALMLVCDAALRITLGHAARARLRCRGTRRSIGSTRSTQPQCEPHRRASCPYGPTILSRVPFDLSALQ